MEKGPLEVIVTVFFFQAGSRVAQAALELHM